MSDSSIIKEFLVALGFKVEEDQLKKWTAGIERAEKLAGEFAVAAEAMATAVVAATVKVTDGFEDLYYSSQRIRDSVGNIRAFRYEISQLGGDGKSAMASLEQFGDFLRTNPASEGLLKSLGIQTRDAQGNLRSTTEMLGEFGRLAKTMPLYQARAYASILGIDNRTLDALMRGTEGMRKHYLDMIKESGVDQDKAAEASARWAQRWRDLLAHLALFTDKLVLFAQGPLGKVIDGFKAADKATGGLSTTAVALIAVLAPLLAILDPIVVAVLAVVGAVGLLIADFDRWRSGAQDTFVQWGEWSDDIDAVVEAMGPLLAVLGRLWNEILVPFGRWLGQVFGPILAQIAHGGLRDLKDIIQVITGLIGSLVDLLEGHWSAAWKHAQEAGVASMKLMLEQMGPLGRKIAERIGLKDVGQSTAGQGSSAQAHARGAAGSGGAGWPAPANVQVSGSVKDRAAQLFNFLTSHGVGAEVAKGAAAGAYAENKIDPNAVNPKSGAFGIGQWLGKRRADLFKRYGPHPTFQNQMEFLLSELQGGDPGGNAVLAAQSAGEALDAYVRRFMRPAAGAETMGDLQRGANFLASIGGQLGSSLTVAPQTTINVYGASDPKATGAEVAHQQDRLNDNLIRYGKAAAS